ncbi:MAG: PEGA domain-containing protein [Candidatus Levybacteria bacterium]|nr:PEGA domain-containing protein [Candidatus Levybacteria bacterium]
MKKILMFIVPFFLAGIIFTAITLIVNQKSGKGALQVTANPKSSVYLNGKIIGQTPLCKCETLDMLAVGEYTVRIAPQAGNFSPFEEKIKIEKSVLTVVDRTFGKAASSDGSIISLGPLDDKKAIELLATSFPDSAKVYIDGSPNGNASLLLKNLTESDHELKLVKEGYKEKIVRIRTVAGYKLTVEAFLGTDQEANITKSATNEASTSGKTVPDNKKVPASVTPAVTQVLILDTPTGFLRVRESSSLDSAEIARVSPGDKFDLISEENGWYQIKLLNGESGWVNAQYAQKQ